MLDVTQTISKIDGSALKDISTYLKPARFGSTALVGFFPSSPMRALHDVQQKGFQLTTQALENGGLKFFSKNKIRSTRRDDGGARIQREISGTFLLMKLMASEGYMFLTRDDAEFVSHGLPWLCGRNRSEGWRGLFCQSRKLFLASAWISAGRELWHSKNSGVAFDFTGKWTQRVFALGAFRLFAQKVQPARRGVRRDLAIPVVLLVGVQPQAQFFPLRFAQTGNGFLNFNDCAHEVIIGQTNHFGENEICVSAVN